jgi:hypothetical protein
MTSPDDPKHGNSIAKASQAATEPGTLTEGEQPAGTSATGAAIVAVEDDSALGVGRYRRRICALLFFAHLPSYGSHYRPRLQERPYI